MKKTIFILFLFLFACTNKEVYENIQNDNRNQCTKEPTLAAQEKCKEKLLPYQDYDRQRKEH